MWKTGGSTVELFIDNKPCPREFINGFAPCGQLQHFCSAVLRRVGIVLIESNLAFFGGRASFISHREVTDHLCRMIEAEDLQEQHATALENPVERAEERWRILASLAADWRKRAHHEVKKPLNAPLLHIGPDENEVVDRVAGHHIAKSLNAEINSDWPSNTSLFHRDEVFSRSATNITAAEGR